MATAAPSPLASSRDKTNGAKLSRLLIEGGTTALRKVFDGFHPPASLAANLNTNYSVLNNLLRRRILNRSQWDKLFPPSGAAPDSKSFDITLLFQLLSSICGLLPPPSGWHTKPPLSDNSLEANLARIKFFRNEIYGHVVTTGITNLTFGAFWQEISDALVALGLDKSEIVRLRAEHGGEEAYLDVLCDWIDSESEIKTMVKKGYHALTAEIAKVQSTQQEERKTLHEVKEAVDALQDKIENKGEDEVLKKLALFDFTGDINYHVERYQTETREWIFDEVQNWLDDRSSRNRLMIISGQAGMGKSVIAAVICKRMQEDDRMSGSHFCQHNNVRYRNPKLMLHSLAYQLSRCLPEYKVALVEQLSRNLGADLNNMGVEDLFAILFKEPLASVPDPGKNILMVLDGLDESEYQGRNELLDVLAAQFCKLPLWMRFLVTTRPEKNITTRLSSLNPFELKGNDQRNLEDVRLFFERRICGRTKPEERAAVLDRLVLESEGLMLYAYFVIAFIENSVPILSLENLERSLPVGISAIYQSYFKRLENDFQKELHIDVEHLLQFLCAVMEARSPLPMAFIYDILGFNTQSLADQRNLQKCISCLSTLFPIRNYHLQISHKSIKDWLTDKSHYGEHHFTIEVGMGHKILSKLCAYELDGIKRKYKDGSPVSDTELYALQHGVQHMLQAVGDLCQGNRLEEIFESYITDPELLYAKLCVEEIDPLDDLLCVQSQANSDALGEESRRILEAVLTQFRKHGNSFRENPSVIFQNLLNEENPKLSSRAAAILEEKYSDVSYLELLDKTARQGPVQANFHCTSEIACFDVSPNFNHMVCECRDGTIHLWSLQSGKREWVRFLAQMRNFDEVPHGTALRSVQTGNLECELTWSLYRSVVFHPNGDFVLPGELAKVYTLSGESAQLFPSSKCRFSVCSFSGGRTKMLTDFPDQPKTIALWNMENGELIRRIEWEYNIISFAFSQYEIVAAVLDCRGDIFLLNLETALPERKASLIIEPFSGLGGLLRFKCNDEVLVCGSIYQAWDGIFLGTNQIILREEPPREKLPLHRDRSLWPVGESSCDIELKIDDCPSHVLMSRLSDCQTGTCCMLEDQTVLVSNPALSHVTMLNASLLKRNHEHPATTEIGFSIDGTTVYTTTQRPFGHHDCEQLITITGWTIESGDLGLQSNIHHSFLYPTDHSWHPCFLKRFIIPLRGGVLLHSGSQTVEFWNKDFSKCVLPMVNEVKVILPISEELVGCLITRESCFEVHVLRIKKGQPEEIVLDEVLTLPVHFEDCLEGCIACSSQFQIVLMLDGEDQEWTLASFIGKEQIWRKEKYMKPHFLFDFVLASCVFSPHEECVAVCYALSLKIVNARTGENLHTLLTDSGVIHGYTFLCDSESLVCVAGDDFIRMFDVKSGDLLTEMDLRGEGPVQVTASSLEPLIAVGFSNTTVKLIRARKPGLKDSNKAKESIDRDEKRRCQVSPETPRNHTIFQSWCTLW